MISYYPILYHTMFYIKLYYMIMTSTWHHWSDDEQGEPYPTGREFRDYLIIHDCWLRTKDEWKIFQFSRESLFYVLYFVMLLFYTVQLSGFGHRMIICDIIVR